MNHSVYHGSKSNGLKMINPSPSTHQVPWVYATNDPVMSAVFIGQIGGDFTLKIGRDENGMPYISERFKDALGEAYSGGGSLYELDGDDFLEGKTSWLEEVVSEKPVKVLKETAIKDMRGYLLGLAESGELKISIYPEKYMCPPDDADIVEKAVLWTQQFGPSTLENLNKYHPGLVAKVKSKLEKEIKNV